MKIYMYMNPETNTLVKSSQIPIGIDYYPCESGDNVNDFYIKNNKLQRKPEKPDGPYIWNNKVNAWIDPRSKDEKLVAIRKERNALLLACDWTQLADADLTPAKKLEWKEYRRKLKDITKLSPVVWPKAPK